MFAVFKAAENNGYDIDKVLYLGYGISKMRSFALSNVRVSK
jgi:hypothetical protein